MQHRDRRGFGIIYAEERWNFNSWIRELNVFDILGLVLVQMAPCVQTCGYIATVERVQINGWNR